MAYGSFRDLPRRTASGKALGDKAFKFAKYSKYNGCQRGLTLIIYKFFDKKLSGRGTKNENIQTNN